MTETWVEVRDLRYGDTKKIKDRLWKNLQKLTYNGKPRYQLLSTEQVDVAPEKKNVAVKSVAAIEPAAPSEEITDEVILKHIEKARTLMALDRIKEKIGDRAASFEKQLSTKDAEIRATIKGGLDNARFVADESNQPAKKKGGKK